MKNVRQKKKKSRIKKKIGLNNGIIEDEPEENVEMKKIEKVLSVRKKMKLKQKEKLIARRKIFKKK